jgi:hypothetical protein
VRDAEPVAGLARRDDALGRAAGAIGVGTLGVEPEPQRHADRVGQRAEERHGAVDSAAHRDGDAPGRRTGAEDRAERVRERIDGERLSPDRGRLEQRQAVEPALEARRVGLDDPVAVHAQPDGSPLAIAARVSEHLQHSGHGRRGSTPRLDRTM